MKVSSPRFVFLDALRGFAALCVLLHHLYVSSMMFDTFRAAFGDFAGLLLKWCACGVDIFFVLSGYVIAHSLRDNALSCNSLLNFIGRRHIRLDLPYWTMVAVGVGLIAFKAALPSTHPNPLPTLSDIVMQSFYLQYIRATPAVVSVAWTLCLEVQFYLLFVLLLCAGNWLSPRAWKRAGSFSLGAALLVAVSGGACLAGKHFGVNFAYFWSSWHFFAFGVLSYWTATRALSPFWFWAMLALWTADLGAAFKVNPSPLASVFVFHLASPQAIFTGIATAGAIYFVARRGTLELWSGGRIWQFLGRISYSLYLTHVPILLLALRAAFHLTGANRAVAVFWFLLVGAICLGVAELFFRVVEAPSMRLATRFKTAPSTSLTQKIEVSR